MNKQKMKNKVWARYASYLAAVLLACGLILAGCEHAAGDLGSDNSGVMSGRFAAALEASVPAAPDQPVVIAGDGQLTVLWDAVPGAESYEVWLQASNENRIRQKCGDNITGTSFTITGLTNDIAYYVWVKAKNSAGTSGLSPKATGTPSAFPQS